MTTTVLSICIYLSQQLLAKKLVKVNKNCCKFIVKYFKAIPTLDCRLLYFLHKTEDCIKQLFCLA